jgi:hypothetical protein
VALRPTLSRGLPLSSDGAVMAPTSRGEQEVCQGRIPCVGAGTQGVQAPVDGTREREGSTDPAKRDHAGQPIRDLTRASADLATATSRVHHGGAEPVSGHDKACTCELCLNSTFDALDKIRLAAEIQASWHHWTSDERGPYLGWRPWLPVIPWNSWFIWFAGDAPRRAMTRAKVEVLLEAQRLIAS